MTTRITLYESMQFICVYHVICDASGGARAVLTVYLLTRWPLLRYDYLVTVLISVGRDEMMRLKSGCIYTSARLALQADRFCT